MTCLSGQGNSEMDYSAMHIVTYAAAVGAAVYLVRQLRRAQVQETSVVNDSTRKPRYRRASVISPYSPIPITALYRDGPMSWVAEAGNGIKYIAYSSNPLEPPEIFQQATYFRAAQAQRE